LDNLNGRDHEEYLGIDDWKITLEWILGKEGGKLWTGCIWVHDKITIRKSEGRIPFN